MENPGIDPGTSHMLSERSTTWANSPYDNNHDACVIFFSYSHWPNSYTYEYS